MNTQAITPTDAIRRLSANREKVHELIKLNLEMVPTKTAEETRVWLDQQDKIDELFKESNDLLDLAYPRTW